jgi:pyruvate/2-oxoglutarate/acetoin dehydrogenase E1 component
LLASVRDPNPVIVLEHKLLYKTEGPLEARTRIEDTPARIGEAKVLREGTDLTLAAYSLLTVRALEAAEALADAGISAEVIDLRTVRPLDIETVRASVRKTGRLLIAHEAPTAVGVGAEVAAGVVESDALDHLLAPVRRVCGKDIPMPYARELERATIPQVEDVIDAAKELMKA